MWKADIALGLKLMKGRREGEQAERQADEGEGATGPRELQYDSGTLPFDDYAPAPGEEYQFYEDLVHGALDQYHPPVLLHFTSDENISSILENGPLSGHAGFGEGLYCVDESALHLKAMTRVYILQQMYCKLAYMDREPCDTGLLARARHANTFVRLDTRKILQDGRFGVLRIINGQTNKMLTNYLIYKRMEHGRPGGVPAHRGEERSLNVISAGGLKRSLVTPEFFALPSHGWHPHFEASNAATHVPTMLQVRQDELVVEAASLPPHAWHVTKSGRYQAPTGTALRSLQDGLHHVSMACGTDWQFRPVAYSVRGHARKEQYLAQERARSKRK